MLTISALIPLNPLQAAALKTLYAFPNQTTGPYSPQAGLVKSGAYFYGTTYWGGTPGRGTVIKIDAANGHETTLHAFTGTDGANPAASLIVVGGMLYGTTQTGGASGRGTVFRIDPTTGAVTTLHAFSGPDGAYPVASLLDIGGLLYGTASAGGSTGNGTIFTVEASSGVEATIYSFAATSDGATPNAGLIKFGTMLYGTTAYSNAGSALGTIFQFDPTTGIEKAVGGFGGVYNGGVPLAPLIAVGNTLYGTTEGDGQNGGCVFSYVPATGTETILHSFPISGGANDGDEPAAALVASGGMLYGTTENGGTNGVGTVFQIDPTTGAESVIASFTGANGGNPLSALIAINGLLYGTTSSAGFYDSGPMDGLPASLPGTIFKIDPKTATLTTLATFPGINPVYNRASSLLAAKGILTGITAQGGPTGHSAAFTVNASTGAMALLADLGATDLTTAPLISGKTALYGTTKTGGASGAGSVYSLNPGTGAQSTIYSFTNGNDGGNPVAPLLDIGGTLFGTAQDAGVDYAGTVYKLNPKTHVQTPLYNFQLGGDGGLPTAGLVALNGLLYGTATYGGTSTYFAGVVFAVNPKTGIETVLHSFGGGTIAVTDGAYPTAGLINVGGILYGTTPYGGPSLAACLGIGCGTVFSVDPKTATETVLYDFTGGPDGGIPEAPLVNVNGTLYGTASTGGAFGYGTIFSIDIATGTQSTLYSFTGLGDGATPTSSLTNAAGTLYGTTNFGGPGNTGTVFSLVP